MGNCSIKAEVKGLGTKLLILTYQSSSEQGFKVIPCINDRINVKVSVSELCGVRIAALDKSGNSRANQIRFFLDSGDDIAITGNATAKSITYNVEQGNELSKQYGKLHKDLLPDFWGSWCSWCLKDLPNMKECYNKYKPEFEFVGIACHDSKSALEKAIKRNQIEWINILDDKQSNDLETKYGISTFPTKIIIDQQGRIIRRFTGESSTFYQVVDSIMEKTSLLEETVTYK